MTPVQLLFAVLSVVVCGTTLTDGNEQKVSIGVYFESLCPDSIRFVTKQLGPTWESDLRPYLNVTLVPFGKASAHKTPNDGWSFQCQHGPDECRGNMLMSCGLHLLQKSDPEQEVPFVDCVMSSGNPPNAGKTCSKPFGLDFDDIQTCMNGGEGADLLSQNGVRTGSLQPHVSYVPWIVINGEYSHQQRMAAERNLPSVVCANLDPKPKECQNY